MRVADCVPNGHWRLIGNMQGYVLLMEARVTQVTIGKWGKNLAIRFPADITLALEKDQINLQEAILLSRLTAERLGLESLPAKKVRQEILAAHLQAKGSQNSLRLRIHDLLHTEAGIISSATMSEAVQKVDELLEVDPDDLRYLFFEEIRNLFYALKEIEPAEVTEADLERFSQASDQVFNIIQRIRRRRNRQALPRPFSL